MVVGLVTFELHLPQARSLKDKRRVVKSLVERLHQKHRISIMESGFQDLHQRAEIAVALVAASDSDAERKLEDLRREVDQEMEAVVTIWDDRLLEEMG